MKKHAPQPPVENNYHLNNGKAHQPTDDVVVSNENNIEKDTKVDSPVPYNNGHRSVENNKDEHNQGIEYHKKKIPINYEYVRLKILIIFIDRLHNSQSVTEQLVTTENPEGTRGRSPHRSQSSPSMQTPMVHSNEALSHALYGMVERVRRDTQLGHDLSRVAVSTVLDCLKVLIFSLILFKSMEF